MRVTAGREAAANPDISPLTCRLDPQARGPPIIRTDVSPNRLKRHMCGQMKISAAEGSAIDSSCQVNVVVLLTGTHLANGPRGLRQFVLPQARVLVVNSLNRE